MDRELVRTCSSEQAAVLTGVKWGVVRIGPHLVRIQPLRGRHPIDPGGTTRYAVRVELIDADADSVAVGADATDVIRQLFGVYLDVSAVDDSAPIPMVPDVVMTPKHMVRAVAPLPRESHYRKGAGALMYVFRRLAGRVRLAATGRTARRDVPRRVRCTG